MWVGMVWILFIIYVRTIYSLLAVIRWIVIM